MYRPLTSRRTSPLATSMSARSAYDLNPTCSERAASSFDPDLRTTTEGLVSDGGGNGRPYSFGASLLFASATVIPSMSTFASNLRPSDDHRRRSWPNMGRATTLPTRCKERSATAHNQMPTSPLRSE